MDAHLQIIKSKYLQYVRSYSYLLIVGVSLFIAFGLIPPPDAEYTTMRFGQFTGTYNSVWIGFVTASLSSIMLTLFGFFLVHGSIKNDIQSRMGQIIGTSNISNYAYLFTTFVSNFLILANILIIVFLVSVGLFYLYSTPINSLAIMDFIQPYGSIALPSLFFTAGIAVFLEVLFPRRAILQYGLFLLLFFSLIATTSYRESNFWVDLLGTQYPASTISEQVQKIHPDESTSLTVGFVSGGIPAANKIEFQKIFFPGTYYLGRLLWVLLAVILVYFSGFIFHRFDLAPQQKTATKNVAASDIAEFKFIQFQSPLTFDKSALPLIKAELLILIRKNNKWIWLLTFVGMSVMFFVSTRTSHRYILPILWFLQVAVWSDLMSRDYTLRTFYFTASAYQPIRRLFAAKCVSGVLYALIVASPLVLKLMIEFNFYAVIHIILGASFITALSAFLGTLTRGKKLFEILFFFLVYCNINLVPFTDYFGAVHFTTAYTGTMLMVNSLLFIVAILLKRYYDR